MSVYRKWELFPFNMFWRYKICITWFLHPCRHDLTENLGKATAQERKKSSSGWHASLKNAFDKIFGINLGFWETNYLPLP